MAAAEVRALAPETARSAAEAGGGSIETVLGDAAADRTTAAHGTCIGAATTWVLWLSALLVGVAVVVVGELRLRRLR